jgi:hypothetical protein
MRLSSLLSILGIAITTMALTLGILVPGSVDAEADANRITPQITQPELTVDGCQITVTTDKSDYGAGEKPTLFVKATNPTDQRIETTVALQILSSSPASPLSRVVAIPLPLWTDKWDLVLGPGESRSRKFETEALPEDQQVTVNVMGGDVALIAQQINVLRRPASAEGFELSAQQLAEATE